MKDMRGDHDWMMENWRGSLDWRASASQPGGPTRGPADKYERRLKCATPSMFVDVSLHVAAGSILPDVEPFVNACV